MVFPVPHRLPPLLIWSGLVLMAGALGAGLVTANWNGWVGLGLAGGAVASGGLILSPNFWHQRLSRTRTNAVVRVLAVVSILISANSLLQRYPLRLDLTENHLFTLAPESQQLLHNLTSPVKAWVFSPQLDSRSQALLENFRRQNPANFSFELVDPQIRPGLAEAFGVRQLGEVYLESGERRLPVPARPFDEGGLVNTLNQITSGDPQPVYFLQGHGEHPLNMAQFGLSQAAATLKDHNFQAQTLNLGAEEPPSLGRSVLVVAGPRRPLLSGEIATIQNHLDQGGNLFLLLDPDTETGLDKLLTEWGITLDPRLVVDSTGQLLGLNPTTPVVTDYGPSQITQDFDRGVSFFPLSQSLQVQATPGIEATPLLLTSPRSWAESDLEQTPLSFDPKEDQGGPLTLGVALSRQLPGDPEEPKEARLVVIGNSTFATNGLFREQLNGDVFLNSVTWLSQTAAPVMSVRPSRPEDRRLLISNSQGWWLGFNCLILFPALGLGGAGVLWWRQR